MFLGRYLLWVAVITLCVGCATPKKKEAPALPQVVDAEIRLPAGSNSTMSEYRSESSEAPRPEQALSRPPAIEELQTDAIAAGPEVYTSWDTYQHEHRFDCVGRLDTLEPPQDVRLGEWAGSIEGHRMVVNRRDGKEPTSLRIGVLSAPKDASPTTLANIDFFFEWFKKKGVTAVVVNGDVAYAPEEFDVTLQHLAESRMLVIVTAGNADANGTFNRVMRKVSAERPNLVNGNLVRLVEVGPLSLLLLAGYHDPNFINPTDGCQYYREDLLTQGELARQSRGTRVLIAHGPPRGTRTVDIDYAFDAGNVGDPAINQFMSDNQVSYGIFGHILESGGRAINPLTGRKVKHNQLTDGLWLNAGCATSLETMLHSGVAHVGMAVVVEFNREKARYWVNRRYSR